MTLSSVFRSACLVYAFALSSAFLVTIPAGKSQTFFTDFVNGELDLHDLRLRYDIVEPHPNQYITCVVTSPLKHTIKTMKASHGHFSHRARETGEYQVKFTNDHSSDIALFFDLEAPTFGHRVYHGQAAADVSVSVAPHLDQNKGQLHTLDAETENHIVFVRFDLDSIPSEYYINDPSYWVAQLNATLQMYVHETSAPRSTCTVKHHYADPNDKPAALRLPGAEKADYRTWKWDENALSYANRPRNGVELITVPCIADHVLEVDVAPLVVQALHAPVGSRELTFEISSTAHDVKFFSRNHPEEYKKPHLNVAMFPTLAVQTLLELSEEVFTVRGDQVYHRMRERDHRNTVESANFSSMWFEVLTWAVSVVVLIGQIVFFRRLLASRQG